MGTANFGIFLAITLKQKELRNTFLYKKTK